MSEINWDKAARGRVSLRGRRARASEGRLFVCFETGRRPDARLWLRGFAGLPVRVPCFEKPRDGADVPLRAHGDAVWVRILVVHRYDTVESSVRPCLGMSCHIWGEKSALKLLASCERGADPPRTREGTPRPASARAARSKPVSDLPTVSERKGESV